MDDSKYGNNIYTYEVVDVPKNLLDILNKKLSEGEYLIKSANENEITQAHLSWIESFSGIISEIDPLGEADNMKSNYSTGSLVMNWYLAQFGGNYSSHHIEVTKPTQKFLDAKIFHKYYSVLLSLQGGKAKIVKTRNVNSKDLKKENIDTNKIFIVHGHDELAKLDIARFVEKMGLEAIILHEQVTSGATIIEKIEKYSNVMFGIVLYTPCDIGSKKNEESNLSARARQNVVFEHGYLIGKLGRGNVSALVKGTIELPNDISGIVYIQMDDNKAWKIALASELKNAGYSIDFNKIF